MIPPDALIEKYIDAFPSEASNRDDPQGVSRLLDFIRSQPADRLYSRDNPIAHITASGFILTTSEDKVHKVLLYRHPIHRQELPPGGHYQEGDGSPLDTARRQIERETGLTNLEYIPAHFDPLVPLDIDSHHIRGNPNRGERPHWHHDFRYVFFYSGDESGLRSHPAGIQFFWEDISTLAGRVTFAKLGQKIKRLLSDEFQPRRYYEDLQSLLPKSPRANSIVVTHFVPDAPVYLRAVHRAFPIISAIPKPRSIDQHVLETVSSSFRVDRITRDDIEKTDVISEIIESSKDRVILFDIGGYFSPIISNLCERHGDKLLGVIEDTENGHRRYESISDLKIPIISVARSDLKGNEDYLIGHSVLFSADALLRDRGKLLQFMNCSVIGFGRLGSSIAHHLLLRGIRPNVFDIDPIRMVSAHNRYFNIRKRQEVIERSDVIFCATGSQSLDVVDFRSLKPGCFIFSVTSSDDEMDLRYFEGEFVREEITKHIIKYSGFQTHFYLVNDGNAVNFIHNAVVGEFIHLVRAEMILAGAIMASRDLEPRLQVLDQVERQEIAARWLRIFTDERLGHVDLGA